MLIAFSERGECLRSSFSFPIAPGFGNDVGERLVVAPGLQGVCGPGASRARCEAGCARKFAHCELAGIAPSEAAIVHAAVRRGGALATARLSMHSARPPRACSPSSAWWGPQKFNALESWRGEEQIATEAPMGHRSTYWWNAAASAFIFLAVQALIRATVEAIQEGKLLLLVKLILFEVGIGLVICGLLYAALRTRRYLRRPSSRLRPSGRSLMTSDGAGRARLPHSER
jgi:hypothetical protein